jgi:hypothetical protein
MAHLFVKMTFSLPGLMTMRIYALYGRTTWVAILYIGVALGSAGTGVVSFQKSPDHSFIDSVMIGLSGRS